MEHSIAPVKEKSSFCFSRPHIHYVPYYQVSTVGQGKAGLGLSAQHEIVSRFLKAGDHLLAEFVEVESGKCADRPQLAAAIEAAKQQGTRLLIAKLDRLSRNVSFIFSLRNAEVALFTDGRA